MKVKDLYWAARNSTFFINLESEGRPLLCEPRLSDEGGVRIRLWLRDLAGTGTGGAIALLSRDEAAVLANAIDTRRNWVGEKADDALPRIGVSATVDSTMIRFMECRGEGHIALTVTEAGRLASWLHDMADGCWAAPSGHDVRFEDAAGRWVYEGQLRADTVRHGVIPDRSNHQERHEILRVESFDGDVKAVQSFLNEHDAGYIAEVTPEQPIIVEALGNKACVYVTKIVQCELRDVLRLLEAK